MPFLKIRFRFCTPTATDYSGTMYMFNYERLLKGSVNCEWE